MVGLTKSQRYNKRLDEIWDQARRLGRFCEEGHHYISTWQGWVCRDCGKAKTGKTLKPSMEIKF